MAASPFDSALLSGLYGDPGLAALFTPEAEIRAMLRVEAALARVQAGLGILPAPAAAAIEAAAARLAPDPAALAARTAADGVPVPALVATLREALPPEHAAYLHWGATSQDILDTALVLRLSETADLLDARLARLAATLADQAARHHDTPMAARTRFQPAAPTTFGARIAIWADPLPRHRARLAELRPRLLRVSLAGAAGTGAAHGDQAETTMRALAEALGLGPAPLPWHAARDAVVEFGGWLALVAGSCGKIGTDLLLFAQSGEVRAGNPGGSSTLPQKANPVAAEALVTLARLAAGLAGTLCAALPHAQERDGTAWGLEWHALPQLAFAAGAALRHAGDLAETLAPDRDAMRAVLSAGHGTLLAEAAVFALAAHMPRPEAQALVKSAAAAALAENRPFAETLAERTTAPIDWPAFLDPARHLGDAPALPGRLREELGE